jgi:hypothetical protein
MANSIRDGLYLNTTDVFDSIDTREIIKSPDEFRNFITRLRQSINNINIAVNLKDTGYYILDETANGQVFFPNQALNSTTSRLPTYRNVLRKVINFGALPNNTTKSVPHGIVIDALFSFTRIYATATNPNTSFIPLPYASTTAGDVIELNADTTNVNITTHSNKSAYTITYVILEWIIQ